MIEVQKEVRKESWNAVSEIMNRVKGTHEEASDTNPGGIIILEFTGR